MIRVNEIRNICILQEDTLTIKEKLKKKMQQQIKRTFKVLNLSVWTSEYHDLTHDSGRQKSWKGAVEEDGGGADDPRGGAGGHEREAADAGAGAAAAGRLGLGGEEQVSAVPEQESWQEFWSEEEI